MSESTRDRILAAAGGLFAVKTYSAVSIRDVAAKAGVSPALVMKLVGSKDDLFRESTRFEPLPHLIEAPPTELGRVLVADVVHRRDSVVPDPLARAVVLLMPAPDPEEVRRIVRETYVRPLAARLGEVTAELVIALLAGLTVSLRLYHHLDEATITSEDLIDRYGALVQGVIDEASVPGAGR
ncbi:TetR/AcrR family transcriptional regulator [Raineyella sp. W15-4]|uniref:TetR/AcrR family transcriptional regulator n=1 Tax=Raineyella sp. W15-4 TaxID=3081651 RepID=UPI0029539DF1|nr:TetR family transcriptional regulator [Raineyella sp. W15-4]WOQ16734.1 TetR family transcriptional regulator [Raineyella sp. W15-4]